MTPPALAEYPQIVSEQAKLTRAQVDRILAEENGASALIVLMRNDKVDADLVIDAIVRQQNRPKAAVKRWVLALVESLLPI